jgi:alpha-glucosidase
MFSPLGALRFGVTQIKDRLPAGGGSSGIFVVPFLKDYIKTVLRAAIAFSFGVALTVSQAAPSQVDSLRRVAQVPSADADGRTASDDGAFDPVADPRAVFSVGKARFTVLTPELIRMEWAADGVFEDHASFVFLNRRMPVPAFSRSIAQNDHALTIRTDRLVLHYRPTADGRFNADNLSISLQLNGKAVVWRPGLSDNQNLLGTTRTLDGARGSATKEPIEQGLISRSGWALIDDSARPLFDSADFRFLQGESSPWPWVLERPAGERQDWYFFGYGHRYRQALGDYVRVAGRIPLPPRFAFGSWWSRYWSYSDQEIRELARGFRENDTPLDVFVIDMDWHPIFAGTSVKDASGQPKGWTGYSWNKLLFPDPEQLLAQLHRDGLKISLNLHPASGIQPWEDRYPEMARAMGIDPSTRQYVPFDPTDKSFATNYLNLIIHPLEKQGVDFWWLDWQQQPTTKIAGVTPTWWLNYVHFTDQQRQGKRPLLFHRWGGLGNHRYQIGFSGDTISVWDSLAFQPWFTATAANVGYAYWSHDIGGHVPGTIDPELYTRWVQFGAFSPILRTHTTKNPDAERRIWAYPEPYSSILRSTFQLRYALQPYLYTEGRRTYDTGVAFLRPLYYDWPEESAAYNHKGEYLFGEQVLVAPVVAPVDKVSGLAKEEIWLPPGEWIEEASGKYLTGPATFERRFSIDQIPVYFKVGAIVPMQPPMHYTGEKPVDPLIVTVWPLKPNTSSEYSVYEDSGAGVEYQYGVYARTPIRATQNGDVLRVEIGPVVGSYPGMPTSRSYELRLPADWPPSAVGVNGNPVQAAGRGHSGWSFEGNKLTTAIPVPKADVHLQTIVEVHRAAGALERRRELDGFAGIMSRLRTAFESTRQTWPVTSVPPDPLIDAMQAGDRLSYHPESAATEIARLHELLPRAAMAVEQLRDGFVQRDQESATQLGTLMGAELSERLKSDRQRQLDGLERAQLMIEEAARSWEPVRAPH